MIAVSACPFQPLDAANLAELKVALNGFLQKGETIKLETKVEPVDLLQNHCDAVILAKMPF